MLVVDASLYHVAIGTQKLEPIGSIVAYLQESLHDGLSLLPCTTCNMVYPTSASVRGCVICGLVMEKVDGADMCEHKWILLTTLAYENTIFENYTVGLGFDELNSGASVRGCIVCGVLMEKIDQSWDLLSIVNPYYDYRMELFASIGKK